MNKILLLLVFLIPTVVWGELVCPLIDGCPIQNGICKGCVERKNGNLIQPIIKSNLISTKKKLDKSYYKKDLGKRDEDFFPTPSKSYSPKKCKTKWRCVVGPCDFIDSNGCKI